MQGMQGHGSVNGPGYLESTHFPELDNKATESSVPSAKSSGHRRSNRYPQQMIDKIWKRFTSSRFEQPLAVLPPCNESPQSTSEHTNESFNAGYERAACECRQKVDWIIMECKTMNQKYRDPDWDLVSRRTCTSVGPGHTF